MNLKLFKIAQLFKKENIELKNLVFGEIKTADGAFTITFQGEDIVVGEPVFVITDEGELPAPDGEHILEDGRKVIVEGGLGVVSEVVAAEGVAEDVVTESPDAPAEDVPMKKDDVQTPLSKEEVERTITERVRKFEEDIKAEYDAKIESLESKFKSDFEKYNEIIEGIYQVYVKISEEPAVKPVQAPKKFVSEKKRLDDMWNKINKRK